MDEKIIWSIGFVLVVMILCYIKPDIGRIFLGFFYLIMAFGVNTVLAFTNTQSIVRIFDPLFTVPSGLLSVYLLWVKPDTTYPVQFIFYGFFLIMIIAVNSMGLVMFLSHHPTFLLRDLIIFSILALIIHIGFILVQRNC